MLQKNGTLSQIDSGSFLCQEVVAGILIQCGVSLAYPNVLGVLGLECHRLKCSAKHPKRSQLQIAFHGSYVLLTE